VKILLICVGTVRGSPFSDDDAHYCRLLRRHARIELTELREREEGTMLRRIPERAFTCALDREGKGLSSLELARFLEERRHAGEDLCFVVGGPFGLDESVRERADLLLSLGPITLPHQLARIVLLEQLFRAHKILAGEPYHY
jgi:23S rRNA (pseudouridine1915-N3)-methyltransferase